MNRHGNHSINDCPLYSEFVSDFAAIADIRLPSAHTVLLIVADSTGVPTATIRHAAENLFAAGLTYVCVWGPDCERVHDIFNEVYVGDGSRTPAHSFLSTWHDDEPLDEALWYFFRCAIPNETDLPTTSFVAATVSRSDLAAAVEHALADEAAFIARMLAEDSPPT